MKRIMVLILLIYFSLSSAINIEKLEYFIDTDPGFGNGTDIPISPDSVITSNFTIDLTGESEGFHLIYTRIKDENGNWSLNSIRPVFKNENTGSLIDIVEMEYFIDTDPGFGNGTDIPITSGTYINKNLNIDISGMLEGFHFIYTRVKDEKGNWSLNSIRPVLKNDVNIIVNIEEIQLYFTGSDANPAEIFSYTNFTPESNIEEFIPQSMLHLTEDEDYCLHIYVIDENGSSSLEYLLPFTFNFTPQNIIVNIENGEIIISWDEVSGADSYDVYSSNDLSIPQSSWFPEETGIIDTFWSEQINVDKKFYYLKAIYNGRNSINPIDKKRRNRY